MGDPGRIPLGLDELEQSGGRPLMSLHSGELTRPSGCCAPGPVKPRSATSSPSLSACLTNSSTRPRAPATATPSRKRTSWRESQSQTDKLEDMSQQQKKSTRTYLLSNWRFSQLYIE